ncbi:hypothetical protein DB30_02525 [Enhygromyxa salina]|uniref:Baseplate protein J-like domain-containing protein n=1 Tax=Enhygromyxa salina TaxID=215803 RepID=A0A0C2DE26_9BACT|nr:hypothetical protein [Enhygromyxa salina]KIG17902.1 hypothetical protein DB30_02525 [Enhygromyxa salina]
MAEDRLTLLCAQTELTGIDFVEVVDPADQTVLRVWFLLAPDTLDVPWVAGVLPVAYDATKLRIWAPTGGTKLAEATITQAQWKELGGRVYLEITVAEPGDFSTYKLEITDPDFLDWHYHTAEFSFKQACPSSLDCKLVPADQGCPEPADGLELNPLARDFTSLRTALLDYATQKYPLWTHRSDADVGVMMLELMAAIGDEFNYIKDRFIREGVLDELSQRRSLRQLVRLLDYEMHDGLSPTTVLELDVAPGQGSVTVDAGTQVWAHRMGEAPIPFEFGEGLRDVHLPETGDPREFNLEEAWNTLTAYEPDGAKPKLAKGATEMFLLGFAGGTGDWDVNGRMLVLHEDPADGSPAQRHLVHVTEYEEMVDALAGQNVTRVAWSEDEALPSPMVIANTTVKANVVPATAGATFTEYFSVRGDGSVAEAEDVVEREGPLNSLATSRPPLFRYSPRQCEALSLGWLGELNASVPEIELQEVSAVDLDEWDGDKQWVWRRTLLDSIGDDEHFTLEDGTWRRIIGYRKPDGTELVHQDWAANIGYTIRFGDGEFGRTPADGTVFRVRYRSGPGSLANVGAGAIVHLFNPVDGAPPLTPDLSAVSNPFDVTTGVDPEDMRRAKLLAPVAFRHEGLSAVTPADYERLAERLDWVQRANASFRWTGSWLTVFVAADPKGAFTMTADQHEELEDVMDCVRQVGRDVHVLAAPDYIDLDLWIEVCLRGGYYAGQVEADVLSALTGPGGFFAPDNFTFGTPLRRSSLEAKVQSVAGVRAVERIDLRAREKTGRREFSEGEFGVGSGQILRVVNDPRWPERGTVVVRVREVV